MRKGSGADYILLIVFLETYFICMNTLKHIFILTLINLFNAYSHALLYTVSTGELNCPASCCLLCLSKFCTD